MFVFLQLSSGNFFFIRESLWVKDGVIQNPIALFFEERQKADVKIDCNNLIIAPGYIDIHLNGINITLLVYAWPNQVNSQQTD